MNTATNDDDEEREMRARRFAWLLGYDVVHCVGCGMPAAMRPDQVERLGGWIYCPRCRLRNADGPGGGSPGAVD